MQETFIAIELIDDGKWSLEKKITGDSFSLSLLLFQLSQQFGLASEDFPGSGTGHGSGIQSSATDSSSPTAS